MARRVPKLLVVWDMPGSRGGGKARQGVERETCRWREGGQDHQGGERGQGTKEKSRQLRRPTSARCQEEGGTGPHAWFGVFSTTAITKWRRIHFREDVAETRAKELGNEKSNPTVQPVKEPLHRKDQEEE